MASEQGKDVRFTAVGLTDVGRVREHNEDNFLAADLAAGKRGKSAEMLGGSVGRKGLTLVVADGMGGAAAGEVASQMAIDTLHQEFAGADLGGTVQAEQDVIALLEASIHKANEQIFRKGQESREHHGMGTTLTVAMVLGDSLYLSQVGDSRGYLLRKGKLVQMTRDQSLIGQLIEEGTLTEEQAEKLGGKNIILQALGVEENLKIESKRYEVLGGDVLLLCSDGLTGMVKDADIERILLEEPDLGRASQKLIDAANAGGGKDNITVLLGRLEGAGLREPLTPLTDAEKAGGSFRAPPTPKSKAGRNAVIATAALLAVVGVLLLRPKPKRIRVTTNVAAKVTVTAESPGLKDFPPRTLESVPGKPLDFDGLPKGVFVVQASAEGYRPAVQTIAADKENLEYPLECTLVRIPARWLKVLPVPYKGGTLGRAKVLLHPREKQAATPFEVPTGPDAKPVEEFPAGLWRAEVVRDGFKPAEQEFEAKSKDEITLSFPPMEPQEQFGTVQVEHAWEGAEVTAYDEDELVGGPAAVLPTRSVSLQVRATKVSVRVAGPGHTEFRKSYEVKPGETVPVPLANHKAELRFTGPSGTTVRILRLDVAGGLSTPIRIGAGGKETRSFDPGKYRITAELPGAEPKTTERVVDPGAIVDLDVTTL